MQIKISGKMRAIFLTFIQNRYVMDLFPKQEEVQRINYWFYQAVRTEGNVICMRMLPKLKKY